MTRRFEREYFCHNCHLQYDGYMSLTEGREPCPHCQTPDPCAVDTFGHCYCMTTKWDMEPPLKGRSISAETFWWREEWMRPEWHALYRTFSFAERHEPDEAALKFWKARINRSVGQRFRKRKAVAS